MLPFFALFARWGLQTRLSTDVGAGAFWVAILSEKCIIELLGVCAAACGCG